MSEIEMLLERVVALLVGIEIEYDSRDPRDILRDNIDSIINVRVDAADMLRKERAGHSD